MAAYEGLNFQFLDLSEGKACKSKGRNHCVPRAIALAEDVDFDLAHDLVASYDEGRRYCPCKTTYDRAWSKCLADLGYIEVQPSRRQSVGAYIPAHGTFIVVVSKHMLTVKDGTVFDTFDSRRTRVQRYFVKSDAGALDQIAAAELNW